MGAITRSELADGTVVHTDGERLTVLVRGSNLPPLDGVILAENAKHSTPRAVVIAEGTGNPSVAIGVSDKAHLMGAQSVILSDHFGTTPGIDGAFMVKVLSALTANHAQSSAVLDLLPYIGMTGTIPTGARLGKEKDGTIRPQLFVAYFVADDDGNPVPLLATDSDASKEQYTAFVTEWMARRAAAEQAAGEAALVAMIEEGTEQKKGKKKDEGEAVPA